MFVAAASPAAGIHCHFSRTTAAEYATELSSIQPDYSSRKISRAQKATLRQTFPAGKGQL